MIKHISYSLLVLILLSGCKNPPSPQNQVSLDSQEVEFKEGLNVENKNKEVVVAIEESLNVVEKITKDLLVNDPVYADKNKEKAIVENKNSDAFVNKPLFLEPIFAKVEIMPYETDNGLYHEQQSVWVKIRKEEIVIKSNPDASNPFSTKKSILNH